MGFTSASGLVMGTRRGDNDPELFGFLAQIDLFRGRIKSGIGVLSATLGGLGSLVFSGGIGENSPQVRCRASQRLGILGTDLDGGRNAIGEPLISSAASTVGARVIPTDEETMIARELIRLGVVSRRAPKPNDSTAMMSQGADRWTRR